jgi:hypothetical protein
VWHSSFGTIRCFWEHKLSSPLYRVARQSRLLRHSVFQAYATFMKPRTTACMSLRVTPSRSCGRTVLTRPSKLTIQQCIKANMYSYRECHMLKKLKHTHTHTQSNKREYGNATSENCYTHTLANWGQYLASNIVTLCTLPMFVRWVPTLSESTYKRTRNTIR